MPNVPNVPNVKEEIDLLDILEREIVSMAKRSHVDRRRSYRVPIASGISAQLEGVPRCRLIEVSLSGCILETNKRLRPGSWHAMEISYVETRVALRFQTYSSQLYELYYSDSGESRIHYHSRAVFQDTSIPALNVLYKIMADHWSNRTE